MTKGFIKELPSHIPEKGNVYRQYKGDLYEVVGIAIHSNEDIWMVVYAPKYKNADAELFTRPISEWNEMVEWEGKRVERFVLVNKGEE